MRSQSSTSFSHSTLCLWTKCGVQVISLQSMGRPLSQLIGCAVQQHIFIYDLAQSFTPQTPKASWAASSTEPICLLRSNPYAAAMYSGACDGAVLLWDLKAPPRQASLKFLQHSRAVTAAEMLNEHSLLTSSADSTILQWDIRNSEQPVRSTVPDGKSVLHLRVSPLNNLLAFATLKVIIHFVALCLNCSCGAGAVPHGWRFICDDTTDSTGLQVDISGHVLEQKVRCSLCCHFRRSNCRHFSPLKTTCRL